MPPEPDPRLDDPRRGAALILVVAVIAALLVIAAILKGLGQAGQFYFLGRIAQGVLRRVRQGVFTNLLRQAPEFFNKRSHGDLLSRLTNDANHKKLLDKYSTFSTKKTYLGTGWSDLVPPPE